MDEMVFLYLLSTASGDNRDSPDCNVWKCESALLGKLVGIFGNSITDVVQDKWFKLKKKKQEWTK